MSLRSEGFIFPSLLCFPTLLDSLNSLSYSFQVLSLVDGKRALVFFHEYFVTRYRITPENICSTPVSEMAENCWNSFAHLNCSPARKLSRIHKMLPLLVSESSRAVCLAFVETTIYHWHTKMQGNGRREVLSLGNYSRENVSISIEFPFLSLFILYLKDMWSKRCGEEGEAWPDTTTWDVGRVFQIFFTLSCGAEHEISVLDY